MFGFLKKNTSDSNLVSSLGLLPKEDGTVMEKISIMQMKRTPKFRQK